MAVQRFNSCCYLILLTVLVYCMVSSVSGSSRDVRRINTLCNEARDSGPCRAKQTRFYYDKTSGACKSFIYGGCRGNGNNFESFVQCNSSCKYVGWSKPRP